MTQKKAKARGRQAGLFERMLRRGFGSIFYALWWFVSRGAIYGTLFLGIAVAYQYARLPDYDGLLDGRESGSVTLLDRYGQVFAWRGQQHAVIDADSISPHLRNAIIATEDRRFYGHIGIDPRGFARAMYTNLQAGRLVQGGSTITQQVAKLVFLDSSRTLERKVFEVPLAIAMELRYSKDDILTIYLNRAYLGAGATGFEAAAQRYFGISARDVNPAQAAMLAGLLKAPSRYSPTRDLSVAQGRADVILGLMHAQGFITDAELVEARANPADLSTAASARAGGYFADWVMEDGPSFLTSATSEDVEVETTFDPRIQRIAEQALTHVFDEMVREGSQAQAAIVVMSPDGAVRALVGGREDRGGGQFNRATQAIRQPGSAFKPVIYAAALEAGFGPLSIIADEPLTLNIPGSGPWSPQNYTRTYLGEITVTEALMRSVNTVAVRLSEAVGRDRVRALAVDMGWQGELADGPALALGVTETTLLDLTGMYATFLNTGNHAAPYGLRSVRLRGDDLPLLTGVSEARQVISPETAEYMTYMLSQVVAGDGGTGRRAALADRPVAGKTGTTQAARDAWFVGFTGDYITGVWMGYDDNSPLTGVTGGGLPAEIWRQVMEGVHIGTDPTPLPARVPLAEPVDLVDQSIPSSNDDPEIVSIFERVLRGLTGQ